MSVAACPFCKFYSPVLSDKQGIGICRKHPPTAFPVQAQMSISVWPTVKPSDWCAEGEQGVSHDSVQAGKDLMEGDKGNGRHYGYDLLGRWMKGHVNADLAHCVVRFDDNILTTYCGQPMTRATAIQPQTGFRHCMDCEVRVRQRKQDEARRRSNYVTSGK